MQALSLRATHQGMIAVYGDSLFLPYYSWLDARDAKTVVICKLRQVPH